MPKLVFQMSADARLLMQYLEQQPVGTFTSYETLTAVISRPIQKHRGALQTALRRLLRDKDMVFGCVHGSGIKRLSDTEIAATGNQATERIRRMSARAVEKMLKADFDALNYDEKKRYTAQVSTMAAISQMTKPKNLTKLANDAPAKKELPIAETLRMFAKEQAE